MIRADRYGQSSVARLSPSVELVYTHRALTMCRRLKMKISLAWKAATLRVYMPLEMMLDHFKHGAG